MVEFTELRISNDGANLVIKAKVRDESYFEDVKINEVLVNTEETYVDGKPQTNPIADLKFEATKEISIILNKNMVLHIPDFKKHLIFVTVVTTGTPAYNTPCGMDNITTLGITMYMGNIYNSLMGLIGELGDNCQIPKGFIDQFLRYKALQTAINSGHWAKGVELYNSWFKNEKKTYSTLSNCGCHG